MNFDGYIPFPDKELGGLANYDDATQIPMGLATVCRNMRFRKRSPRTRDGYQHTMSYAIGEDPLIPNLPAFDITGVDALDVLVNNPQQVVVALTSQGTLLQESPAGSGAMTPVPLPIPLPSLAVPGISMQTAKAYNRIHMAFSDLMNALAPPMVLDGPTGVVSPISQNPIGAIWTPGRYYLPGDVVRTSQNPNRWFRCIVAGTAGNVEPTWPVLDGYLEAGGAPTAAILSVTINAPSHPAYPPGHLYPATAIVSSVVGFVVGGSITIAGNSNSLFNGTWIITVIGTNSISFGMPVVRGTSASGTGGTVTQSTGSGVVANPAQAADPNGTSQWVEWTPGAAQFVPQPEAPEQILSIKGQAGAPAGTIASAQDVYVCFAYQNAAGESQWTAPIVFSNTAASDCLEVFFQKQNENPGPTAAAAYGAAGYGGPRMPQWLISVLGLTDPVLSWPGLQSLTVYVAAVATGATAPLSYYQYASRQPMYQPVVISSIPSTGSTFAPRAIPTAAISSLPFIGASGPRYLAVERIDLNDSLVPIDPGSPLLCNFLSSVAAGGTANITFIQRTAAGVVTCTVDELAGFAQGAQAIIAGVTDSSFNGTFTLTGVSPNQYGGATLIWTQGGSLPASASTGGTATSANAASAFVTPQDLIATISRSSDVVSAVVNSLSGLAVGIEITVAGVAPTSTTWDGTYTISAILPNLGGGGTVQWAQTAANDSSTGGTISPAGAGVGTNAAQNIGFLARNEYPATSGTVICIVYNPDGTPTDPPPGFVVGAQVTVAGANDASFDGTFTLVKVSQNPGSHDHLGGGYSLWWQQTGANAKYSPATGTVTLISGGGPQQALGNVTAIARASNVVTATLDTVANFVQGAEIQVTDVTDPTYDGTFIITAVLAGSSQLQWTQVGPNSSSTGGELTQSTGGIQQPTPVAILPPGGPFIAEDIAAWSVEGAVQAGPFTFLPAQDPVTPFSATIQSIGAVNGSVTALLSSTSGLQAGDTIQVTGTPNGWFDGVFVLAQVNGNTVEWAGVGPGTGYAGGTVALVPTQPTDAMGQNNPVAITTLTRSATGLVSAQIADVANLEPGMRIQVQGTTDPSFVGQFVVLSVSDNQLPGSATPLAGTATWQSSTLSAATTVLGYLTGLPGIILDAIDNDLANGDDVTAQLSVIPAPSCANVYFAEQLNMMVYTIGQDSSHYFSNPGDPANIASPGGILGVAESNGQRTRGLVETISGEIISLKEKSGYEITPGSSTPSQWGVSRRWFGHGPCGPRAWDAADDFIVYFDEDSGLYRYENGRSVQVGQELQGTWDQLNKSASAQVCVSIDSVRKEVHVALPLGNATVPNHDIVLNYFNGWEEPLMLTMSGELMPNPHGRRWSDNDGAASGGTFRLIKVLQRTLPAPPSSIIVHRQVVFCLAGIAQAEGATGYIDMSVPDSFTDNDAAIDWEYQPAFAQSPTLENLLWDKMKVRVLGLGALTPVTIQPVTEDPNADLAPSTIDVSDGLPDSRNVSFSQEVNELFSILYSNQDEDTGIPIPGGAMELHRSVRYGAVQDSGTDED
jgi:hypothetical protein